MMATKKIAGELQEITSNLTIGRSKGGPPGRQSVSPPHSPMNFFSISGSFF